MTDDGFNRCTSLAAFPLLIPLIAQIAVTRSGGERPFATYKQHYKLSRTRFLGLAKNTTFYGLAAIAANIRKGAKFLGLYGIPEPIVLDRWV